MIQLSLKTIVALIIVSIVFLVAATCVGVYLGLAVESMMGIGEGYARSIVSGLASILLQTFSSHDATFSNVESFAKASANQLPSIMKANGQNWTVPWKSMATSLLAQQNFSISSVTLLFADRYWITCGLSFLETGTASSIATNPGERAVVIEWVEDLTGSGSPITVGGERWLVREDFSNPFNRAIRPDPTYGVPESIQQGLGLNKIENPDFAAFFTLLKGRRCIFLGFVHTFAARSNSYWLSLIGCRVQNVSDITMGWSFVSVSMTAELSGVLESASRSPNGHNIIFDSSSFVIATTPGLPAFFTSKEDSTLTPSTPEPDGCSNTEKTNPGVFYRMGCRKSASQFEYAPIPALHAKNPGFFVSDGAVDDVTGADTSDGNSYLAAVKKIHLDTINLRLFVVAVVPFEDIFGDDIATAIGVSVALTLLVAAVAAIVTWALLSHFLSGLEDLQREMENAARMGSGGADDDEQQQQHDKDNSSPSSPLSGWAAVFGAMHDDDMDLNNVDSNNDEEPPPGGSSSSAEEVAEEVAEHPHSVLERRQRHAAMAPSAAAACEGTQQEMEPVSVERVEQSSSNNTTRQRRRQAAMPVTPTPRQAGGSIIKEIAAVELAYKTAIAALRRSTAFVPQQLLAAELLHQRRLAKAAAKRDAEDEVAAAADMSGDPEASAHIEHICATHSAMDLALNIPPSKNKVSILLIQLEQMGEIHRYASPPRADNCDSTRKIDLERSQDATSLLQLYFKRVTRCVMSHGGIVHSFAGCGSEESAMMASWGAPIQREDHSVLAVLCALSILREVKKETGRLRALCEQVLGTKELRVRIAVTSGIALTGCVREFDGQIRYSLLGAPVSTASRLLSGARRWRVPCMVEQAAAVACSAMIKFRLLCFAKIKNAEQQQGGVSVVYEPIGVDTQSPVIISIQRGKLARDAVVAAQRHNVLKRSGGLGGSNSSSLELFSMSQSDPAMDLNLPSLNNMGEVLQQQQQQQQRPSAEALSEENDDDDGAQQYNRVMRHVYGTNDSGGGGNDDDDQTDLSAQQEQGAVSLQLSDAMSVNTIHASDNRGLAEVLVPSSASVERLLRWHADGRTTFDKGMSLYADAFSALARDLITMQFSSAAARAHRIRHDDVLSPPSIKEADGALAYIESLLEMFCECPPQKRNVHEASGRKFFADLMRGNPDADLGIGKRRTSL